MPSRLLIPWPKTARWARDNWFGWGIANLLVASLYFGLGWLVSAFFAAYGLFPAPIWLPTAIATVAAIAGEWRMLPGILLGSVVANAVLFTPPAHVTAIISLTNALGPVIGAVVLRWRRPAKGVFTSFAGVIWFLFCATLLSPAISATGGAAALAIGHPFDWESVYSTWVAWWLCDSGGTLYLAPALLLWLGLETGAEGDGTGATPFDRQYLLIWTAIATLSVVLFMSPPLQGNHIRQAFPFLLVVPLSWVALRMSLRWAYTLVSLVAVTAAIGTVAGYGPFQDQSLANPLQMVSILVVVLAMNVLTVEALVSELHQAQRENRVKSMFLANTSHELKTPLNAILGFSSMIDSAPAPLPNAKYAEYGHIIHSAGEHLLSLINGLMDLSKIEAGKFTLSETEHPIGAEIDEAIALTAVQAEAKSITVSASVAPGDMSLQADGQALRQILLNLVTNALKFTPSSGRVDVSAVVNGAGELVICVADTGIGIPEATLHRLFVPFERLHRDTAPTIEGTGLGLCITRGLVTLHGGTIAVASELGAGTRVTVTFPAERVVAGPIYAEAAD